MALNSEENQILNGFNLWLKDLKNRGKLDEFDPAEYLAFANNVVERDYENRKYILEQTKQIRDLFISQAYNVSSDLQELFIDVNDRLLCFEARYLVDSFFQYLEIDGLDIGKKFYQPRRKRLQKIIEAYQEVYDGKLDFLSISQPKRSGKAGTMYSKVLTPAGFVNMGDVKIGDEVISGSGRKAHIIGVYPQGIQSVYEITLMNDSKCRCSDNHLWKVKDAINGEVYVDELNHILDDYMRLCIPVCTDTGVWNTGIKSIRYVGEEECQCIMIDDPSHLYITDDYIITHNTTSGLRLSLMMAGRTPDGCIFATGKGEGLVKSFFGGMNEIFDDEKEYKRYLDVFPRARKVAQNADDLTIHLEKKRRFATITCRPIDGSVVGNTEANVLLYLDDCVKNHEEARNRDRLEFLCEKVTDDILGRRIEGTPIIIQGTKYSLYDPIAHLQNKATEMGWRWKEVAIPALDPITDESNWEIEIDGKRIFTTEYYRRERMLVTPETWAAEFQQEPYEAKGRLFPADQLHYYEDLPIDREPDAIMAACDTAKDGGDYCSMPIAYVYGREVYIVDVVYDNSGSKHTIPLCAAKLMEHNVKTVTFESNAAGSFFGKDVMEMVAKSGGRCSARYKYNTANKITRMENAQLNILNDYYFKHPSKYAIASPYDLFMKNLTTLTRSGKTKNDDSGDSLALLENEMRTKPKQAVIFGSPI